MRSSKEAPGAAVVPAGYRREGLAGYFGLTPSGVDKLVARGELPKPIKIGRTPFWPKHVIDLFLAKKAESSRPVCQHCNGSGTDPNTSDECPRCGGSSWEPLDD